MHAQQRPAEFHLRGGGEFHHVSGERPEDPVKCIRLESDTLTDNDDCQTRRRARGYEHHTLSQFRREHPPPSIGGAGRERDEHLVNEVEPEEHERDHQHGEARIPPGIRRPRERHKAREPDQRWHGPRQGKAKTSATKRLAGGPRTAPADQHTPAHQEARRRCPPRTEEFGSEHRERTEGDPPEGEPHTMTCKEPGGPESGESLAGVAGGRQSVAHREDIDLADAMVRKPGPGHPREHDTHFVQHGGRGDRSEQVPVAASLADPPRAALLDIAGECPSSLQGRQGPLRREGGPAGNARVDGQIGQQVGLAVRGWGKMTPRPASG